MAIHTVRLMLADPYEDESEMFAAMFTAAGCEVTLLPGDVTGAQVLIARELPDLVVTRIKPGRFGIELTRRIRQDPRTAKVPVMVVTTLPVAALLEEAREAGADDVLLLPHDDVVRLALSLAGRR